MKEACSVRRCDLDEHPKTVTTVCTISASINFILIQIWELKPWWCAYTYKRKRSWVSQMLLWIWIWSESDRILSRQQLLMTLRVWWHWATGAQALEQRMTMYVHHPWAWFNSQADWVWVHPVQVLAGSQYLLYMWHQLYKMVCKTVKVSWYPPRHRLILLLCMSPLYGFFQFPSLVPRPCRRNGLATSVSSNCIRMQRHGNCIPHSSSQVHVIRLIFRPAENSPSCSWKQLFAAGSVMEGK